MNCGIRFIFGLKRDERISSYTHRFVGCQSKAGAHILRDRNVQDFS